ncbi:MAG: Biopolymer transport protein ExbD/TolR [uncultured Campylobacterales bacterium]|uniref:Biopolymer transport protein ExbD/TolR n=1 Tax=uncultured Campylobacterales bacterium TaxID=352960 RepID=A0A6S6SG92_9BACT|nr:MAG: Biopolymer transport protein ExbD/TolR [uncultured Campylobacterales bacterium]
MKKFDQINIIPFVDVLLVLIAIILTTMTLIQKEVLPINTPTSKEFSNTIVKDSITISISKDEKIYIDSKVSTMSELKQYFSDINKSKDIYLNCDKESMFEDFFEVLEVLKNKKFENIFIVVKKD